MAAVASRSSNSSPHLNPRMSSPKRSIVVKNEDNQHKSSPLQNSQDARQLSPPRQGTTAAENPAAGAEVKTTTTSNNVAQPLAPPPRPVQDTPDYFNQSHSTTHHLSTEANPFEHAFGNPAIGDTPGKLPSVAALTSPSSLLPGGTPGWAGSLRSGPLSPAMLTGPTGQSDYFDPHFRGSFPTPNESSLRTGLTPGGGGSMFPAPSPNSQALFNSLQSGGATPSTLDFHRTALSAASQAKANNFNANNNAPAATSQPSDPSVHGGMEHKQFQPAPAVQPQADPFGQQHDHDAANGLYMLAQANGGRNGSFNVSGQPSHIQTNMTQMGNQMGGQSQETSPLTKRATKNSIGSMTAASADTADFSESDGDSQEAKQPTTRSRGKKGSTAKASTTNNGRRKASETPAKQPASKKAKGNNGVPSIPDDMDDSDDDGSPKAEGPDGKKMTDEEKRKNFLERNRVAALKCRQRKKQWLANLQAKVELFSAENDTLSATVTQLREEIVNLKTLLMAHKDCPVSQQQGLAGQMMVAFINNDMPGQNPYGMGMPPPPNGLMMPGPSQGQPPQLAQR